MSRIRERKLVQWVVAYAAVAWVLLQALEIASEAFPSMSLVLRVAITLAIMGVPIVLVVGWYHGEKGRQRVTKGEVALLAVLVFVALGAAYRTVTLTDTGSPNTAILTDGPVRLDSMRIAVLPFRRGSDAPGQNEEVRLRDALARWRELDVVEPYRVREAVPAGAGSLSLMRERRIVADLGAGRFVSGQVLALQDGLRIQAGLFDTGSGESLAQASVVVPVEDSADTGAIERLADQLLFGAADGADVRVAPDSATSSYRARLAFLRGRSATAQWELSRADSLFAEALQVDPAYGRAQLWRAQVRSWNGQDPTELLGPAEAALAREGGLNDRERLLGQALLHMARDEYPEACTAYDSLRERDDRDFAAWYGLGECRFWDGAVVRDPDSPSGWAFRGSVHRGVQAYRRAFELHPVMHRGFSRRPFEWIGERLRLSTGRLQHGAALASDSLGFLARTAWLADSLALIPYPEAEVYAGNPAARPATHLTAVQHQRQVFLGIAESWVTAFPESADAYEALALARELVGDPRALETLDRARALSRDSQQSMHVAAEQMKLLVKVDGAARLRRARALADTILEVGATRAPDARTLAVVAALVGEIGVAADWLREAAEPIEGYPTLPVAAKASADVLTCYAAFGAPTDSIVAYEQSVESVLRNRVPAEQRARARFALLLRPAALAYPSHPLEATQELAAPGVYPLLSAQAAHSVGAAGQARDILTGIRDQREGIRPAEISFDVLFPEAHLWLQLGDTTSALNLLDATLNDLRWAEPGSFHDPAQAASIVRAMALRAELALAAGDRATARRWAEPVAILWNDADPGLQPLVGRMRSIAESNPGSGDPGTGSLQRRN